MATTETLNDISQKFNIYFGLFIFIFGIIGNLWNILIFRHYSLRTSSCCTYMLIGSIACLIQILFSISNRILEEGFQLNWTGTNIVWCKVRLYIGQCSSLTALSCFVLSVIDRFFSVCRQIKWRHLNSVHTARQICLYLIIFWMCVTIPTLIFAKPIELSLNNPLCINSSLIWSKIITYFFNVCCYGIFPWFFMSLFGYLTIRKIRHKRHQRIVPLSSVVLTRMTRIDDQLASMLFLQIIICIISSIPYCIQSLYDNFTTTIEKSPYRQAQDYFFLQIARLIFYLNYTSTFYINYLASDIFRDISKHVLINLCKKQEDRSRQITIVNHQEMNNQFMKPKTFKIATINSVSLPSHN